MKKNAIYGLLVMVLAFGFISCDNGNNGDSTNTDPKTLVITGMTIAQIMEGSEGGFIGVFPKGTSEANVESDNMAYLTGSGSTQYAVAGMDFDEIDDPVLVGSTYTITVPLYNPQSTIRWTGSGTFDIYNAVYDGLKARVYKAANISITSGTTTIPASSYVKIYEENF